MNISRACFPFALGLLTLATSVCLAPLQAQQVVNGSFELDIASTTVQNAGLGWTISNPGAPYIFSNSSGHGTTPYGNQFLTVSGTESQTIAGPFALGQTYRLFVSASDVTSGTVPILNLSVSGGATAGQEYPLVQNGSYFTNIPLAFMTCELDFVPTNNNPITISMFGYYSIAVDNVYLVPEPSTWVFLSLGATGAGAMALRRRGKPRTA